MAARLRQSLEHQLVELQESILLMGSYVAQMLDQSMQALVRQDAEAAAGAIEMDDTADRMNREIERACVRLLALHHPMARDLRIITSALMIVTDLERIADYAVDIAKTARRLAEEPYFQPVPGLDRMTRAAMWMVQEAIQAYVECDLDLVTQVIARDDEVDDWYDRIFTGLLTRMEQDPQSLRPGTWLIHVARFLERIADHAVNVVERVYYIEAGDLVPLDRNQKVAIPLNGHHP